MKFKHTIFILAAFISACSTFDDSAIQQQLKDHEARISNLEKQYSEMKSSIEALKTLTKVLETNDVVTGISPIKYGDKTIGFNVTFSKSNPIQIYINGDAEMPRIGVKEENGVWYWTINGEWLRDENNNRIIASGKNGKDGQDGSAGITPQMKIEDDYWYISYDEGKTWTKLSKASTLAGDSVFKSVSETDNDVTFTLSDGSTITIQKYKKVNITFDYEQGSVILEDSKIPYTITGESETYEISAICDNSSYKVSIEKTTEKTGYVNVHYLASNDAQIVVIVTAPDGESTVRVLTIDGNKFYCDCEYSQQFLEAESGEFTLTVSSNLDITAEVFYSSGDSGDLVDWMLVTPISPTKSSMKDFSFNVKYKENTSSRDRVAEIVFKHKGKTLHSCCYVQKAKTPSSVSISFSINNNSGSTKSSLDMTTGLFALEKGDKVSVNLETYEIQENGDTHILTVPYCETGYDVVYPAIVASIESNPSYPEMTRLTVNYPNQCTDKPEPLCYGHIDNYSFSGSLNIMSALLCYRLSEELNSSASVVLSCKSNPVCGDALFEIIGGNFGHSEYVNNGKMEFSVASSLSSESVHYFNFVPGIYSGIHIAVLDKDGNVIGETGADNEISFQPQHMVNAGTIKPINPQSPMEPSVLFQTEESVKAYVNGIYSALSNFVATQKQLESVVVFGSYTSITASSSNVSNAWSAGYRTIRMVNDFTTELLKCQLDDNVKKKYLAHAQTICGFVYYNMAMLWGDVPLITESDNASSGTYFERTPKSSVLKYAESLIQDALTKIVPLENASGVIPFYLNHDSANLILAEILLTEGKDAKEFAGVSRQYSGDLVFAVNINNGTSVLPVLIPGHFALYKAEADGDTSADLVTSWKQQAGLDIYGYWAMLKRCGKAKSETGCDDTHLLMPIPSSEMMTNPKMVQNPGY